MKTPLFLGEAPRFSPINHHDVYINAPPTAQCSRTDRIASHEFDAVYIGTDIVCNVTCDVRVLNSVVRAGFTSAGSGLSFAIIEWIISVNGVTNRARRTSHRHFVITCSP